MKIDNSTKTVVGIATGDTPKRPDKAGNATPPPVDTNEKVELSPLSSQLQSIESSLASEGVFDAARVEEIKQAISEGRFKVNAEVVADRLLETVKELLQPQGSGRRIQ